MTGGTVSTTHLLGAGGAMARAGVSWLFFQGSGACRVLLALAALCQLKQKEASIKVPVIRRWFQEVALAGT